MFFFTVTEAEKNEDKELTLYILEENASQVKEFKFSDKYAFELFMEDESEEILNYVTFQLFKDSHGRRILQMADIEKHLLFYDVELD